MCLKLALTIASVVAVAPFPAKSQVRIDEVMVLNKGDLKDLYGNASAWLELRNDGEIAATLTGWHLSDRTKKPRKWVFPDTILAPQQRRLVFLSDSASKEGELHTSFKLSPNDPCLLLSNSKGQIIQRVSLPSELPVGYSFHPHREKGNLFLKEATPGKPNSQSFVQLVSRPSANLTGGFYPTHPSITLSSSTADAKIHYTLDGTIPTTASPLYNYPPDLSANVSLRARAFKKGSLPSLVTTHTYIVPRKALNPYLTGAASDPSPTLIEDSLRSVPSVSISFDPNVEFQDAIETPVSIELINFDDSPYHQINAGLTLFGGKVTNFPKKSFRLHFRKRYGDGKLRYPLFNDTKITEFDALDLRSGSHDMAQIGAYLSNLYFRGCPSDR